MTQADQRKNAAKKSKKKKQKWVKPRHFLFRHLLFPIIVPLTYLKYGVKVEKFKLEKGKQYLILFNHQTAFDQFFVGMAFKRPIYYMATEDIFSKGFVSSVIRYLVAPIPIKKQTTDVRAVLNCMKVVAEGGTIAIAPEGNRTYSGETVNMNPSIAMLVKKLNIPVLLYRIEGGYGAHPRWSDVIRKGKVRSYVSRVITPDEYKDMSYDEIYDVIKQGLYVNEANTDESYYHKKSAEYLDRVFYVCPYCGLSTFESHENIVECKKCGRKIEYLPTKQLRGVGFDLPFEFVSAWYDYQKDFVNGLDVTAFCDKPLYRDEGQMSEVIVYENKKLLHKVAQISLYGDRMVIDADGITYNFEFEQLGAVTVLGKNKLNIYTKDKLYQIKGSKRFNALKYVNIFHRAYNIRKGLESETFLGI